MDRIPILIADGQELTREGLGRMVSKHDGFELKKMLSNEDDLLFELTRQGPSVIILDYDSQLFKEGTTKKIKRISPFSKILIVSNDTERPRIQRLIEQGINNYITKDCSSVDLIKAVYATHNGEKFLCSGILDWLFDQNNTIVEVDSSLSRKEKEIIQLIAKGKVATEIAEALELSTHSVYMHRNNLMKKLNFSTTSELVLYAVNEGMLSEA
jgi:DNA-binding NarL/FixJ family response regulator